MSLRFSKEKIKDVMKALKDNYICNWVNTLNTDLGQRQGRNKLRIYKLLKIFTMLKHIAKLSYI